MPRKRFTDKDRARIFAAAGGVCHICNLKIDGTSQAWEIEHVIAWELTRDDSDDNLRPAHKLVCHQTKTHKQDRPAINQAKRREAKHNGVKRPKGSFPKPAKEQKPAKFDMTIRRSLFTGERT